MGAVVARFPAGIGVSKVGYSKESSGWSKFG
jgi:hypothetical protein